ncbi:hypothetical protein B0H19DRAFT_1351815 [Mycena capillaripes]|nr:hypothetical protein B0H19DRAFT_1351815 [Mycena capillaripes]
MAWLNLNLVPYIARLRILPDTQVAMQQGVQTRDLMNYLAEIKCWAKRNKVTVFALKRDQMKGFDYLSPQGMYDAVLAYGLPSSIIDLDRAAQTDTKCFIRTAHGITEPITITGLTKQGGSLSPVKSTLTTSLGHHYINDLAANDPDTLVISSGRTLDPHSPNDSLTTRITMVEATDDSFIFARTVPALRRNVLAMERFQYLDFLRAKVDDPNARYIEIKSFIDDFTFPKFIRRPPITLIRKIVKQNIISKARALLSLQPIKHIDAEDLDTKIKMKIHFETGMPFAPSSDVLMLPIEYHGLDFPSIARINDSIAIDGLHRDLNHPIPSYRTLALISLADWTCDTNGCIDPLDGPGLARDFSRYAGKIPYAWIVAQKAMGHSIPRISLKRTNLPEILPGATAISHALNIFHHHVPDESIPDGKALRSLRLKGVTKLNDTGFWNTALLSNLLPSATSHTSQPTIWGSDGSMIPAAAGVLDPKSVTAALTGPLTIVLKIEGRNVSILQGELIGLIMGLTLSPVDDPNAILYTDHLNSVRLIEDSRTVVDQRHRLRTMNGRSYYRWILALISRNPLKIVYTRGHSDEPSTPSRINFEADHYASSAQRVINTVFTAPIPSFFMDDYTFYTEIDGWIESNIRNFVDKSTARTTSRHIAAGHQQRMALHLYDPTPPPEWSYTHAYSAYSAIIQLYARSGQLPSADLLHSRGKLDTPLCRVDCNAIEDMHHIIVECPRYAEWRTKATTDLLRRAYSVYYLGHIPRINALVPNTNNNKIDHSRLIHHFASDWHTACIRLAGRIWGDWQREMSKKTLTRSRRIADVNCTP